MLELNVYNDIPHLLLPVVTDPKESLRALKWMEAQMDHRYRRLSKHGVRNIEGYNRKVAAGKILDDEGDLVREPMPYYVCIVDELADLMMQLGQEIEVPITRIARRRARWASIWCWPPSGPASTCSRASSRPTFPAASPSA